MGGSSPRIRGESNRKKNSYDEGRIIPANTGRIIFTLQWGYGGRDHPREYGENALDYYGVPGARGSSPRIRGEWGFFLVFAGHSGIIPANTGRI